MQMIQPLECSVAGCRRPRGRRSFWQAPLAGFSAGLLLAAALAGLALGLPGARAARPPAVEATAGPEWRPPALPREWRWERKAITFDHMFPRLR